MKSFLEQAGREIGSLQSAWHYNIIHVTPQPWVWLLPSSYKWELQCESIYLGQTSFGTDYLCEWIMKATSPSRSLTWFKWFNLTWKLFRNRSVLVFAPVWGMLAAQCSQSLSFFSPMSNFDPTLLLHIWRPGGDDSFNTSVFLQSVKLSRCLINNQSVGDSHAVGNTGSMFHFTTKVFGVTVVMIIVWVILLDCAHGSVRLYTAYFHQWD